MRLVLLAVSLIARPRLVLRRVSVTRAFARLRVWFVSRPRTFSVAPGASAVRGGELSVRSFAVGFVAAWAEPADNATSAPAADKHASDLATRSDKLTLLRSPLAPTARCSRGQPTDSRSFCQREGESP